MCSLQGRTLSAHSSLYWLSAILHVSPNLVLYSHHFQGTPLSFASLNTHSCRRFSCGVHPVGHQYMPKQTTPVPFHLAMGQSRSSPRTPPWKDWHCKLVHAVI